MCAIIARTAEQEEIDVLRELGQMHSTYRRLWWQVHPLFFKKNMFYKETCLNFAIILTKAQLCTHWKFGYAPLILYVHDVILLIFYIY